MKNYNYGSSFEMIEGVKPHTCLLSCPENHSSASVKFGNATNIVDNDQGQVNIPYVNEWTIIFKK